METIHLFDLDRTKTVCERSSILIHTPVRITAREMCTAEDVGLSSHSRRSLNNHAKLAL